MNSPSVGRIVHYVSYGTPGGEYGSECRAAVITGVHAADKEFTRNGFSENVHLAVLNPEGMFFNKNVDHDEVSKAGGTWHWPERA